MFCNNCTKLAFMLAERICVRCSSKILNSISCICDNCSNQEKVCSVCLKKVFINQVRPNGNIFGGGCRSCGKK